MRKTTTGNAQGGPRFDVLIDEKNNPVELTDNGLNFCRNLMTTQLLCPARYRDRIANNRDPNLTRCGKTEAKEQLSQDFG